MTGTVRFSFEAGRLLKRSIVLEIKTYCHNRAYGYEITEDGGFLSSMFFVKITAPSEKVGEVANDFQRYMTALEG